VEAFATMQNPEAGHLVLRPGLRLRRQNNLLQVERSAWEVKGEGILKGDYGSTLQRRSGGGIQECLPADRNVVGTRGAGRRRRSVLAGKGRGTIGNNLREVEIGRLHYGGGSGVYHVVGGRGVRAGGAGGARGGDGSLLGGLLDGGINVEGASKPDDA